MIDERASLPDGVLFDFSGTLFFVESARDAVLAALGPQQAHHAGELQRLGAINGSGEPAELPTHLHDAWRDRDLSARAHRAAYSGSARHAGLDAAQADLLYERGTAADAWSPYPDTVRVLRELRDHGVPVAMVSNIGWDPRALLAHHGVTELLPVLVLSYEIGAVKPDPAIFTVACTALGVDPRRALMVGDNPDADGGATALGIRFQLIEPDPASRAPDALARAVGLR